MFCTVAVLLPTNYCYGLLYSHPFHIHAWVFWVFTEQLYFFVYVSFIYLICGLLKKNTYIRITVKVALAYPRVFELEYTGSCNLSESELKHQGLLEHSHDPVMVTLERKATRLINEISGSTQVEKQILHVLIGRTGIT